MNSDRTAYDALTYMTRRHMNRVFICNQEGKLIGLVIQILLMQQMKRDNM